MQENTKATIEQSVRFLWRRRTVSAKEWNGTPEKPGVRAADYPVLGVEKDERGIKAVTFAYMSPEPAFNPMFEEHRTDIVCSEEETRHIREILKIKHLHV